MFTFFMKDMSIKKVNLNQTQLNSNKNSPF